MKGHLIRVPDEDEHLEMVHLIIKNTTPVCNMFACYLGVESRGTTDNTSKLQGKIDAAIQKGEAAILLGDLNRPLQTGINSSFGTKLLNLRLEGESAVLLNDRDICTRVDPATGKGSLLDVSIK